MNYVGVMYLCCQNPKHGRVGFRLKQLRDDQDCHGNLVSCPRRLFPLFDCFGKNVDTGTFICEAHLKLADKDKRICDNEAYTPPKK